MANLKDIAQKQATAAYYHESDKVTQFADDRLIEDGTEIGRAHV